MAGRTPSVSGTFGRRQKHLSESAPSNLGAAQPPRGFFDFPASPDPPETLPVSQWLMQDDWFGDGLGAGFGVDVAEPSQRSNQGSNLGALEASLLSDRTAHTSTATAHASYVESEGIPVPSPVAASATLSPNTLVPSGTSDQSPRETTSSNTVSPTPYTTVGELARRLDARSQGVRRPASGRVAAAETCSGREITRRTKRRKTRSSVTRLDVLTTETAQSTKVKRDTDGRIAGTMTVFGFSQVVRAPASSERKQATRFTRGVGACPRCRSNKFRCDMSENIYEPCGSCMKLVANLYLRRARKSQWQPGGPCFRVDLLDLRLHRKGPTIHDHLDKWVRGKQRLLADQQGSNHTHLLFLTQGFGEDFADAFSVTVSRFEPVPGDRTTYFWTDPTGTLCSFEVPPYFISDLEAARRSIREFITSVRSTYIETLHAESNNLIRQTFQAALVFTAFNKSKLVSVALDYWVAARLIETQWHVFNGGAMIGLEPKNEPGHPWRDFAPVTPIMDSQLDDLVIRDLLVPLSGEFLKRLKAKIDEQRRENWFEIYLALFIMMSNAGWTLKDMMANAAWKGLKAGSRGGTLTQGFMHACKTMLSYFHFGCAGSLPVSVILDRPEGSNRELHGLTASQTEYLKFVQQEMAGQGKLDGWKDLSMYEDDGYWCYQLLCRGWRGDVPHNGGVDDFREEDFLSSSTV